MMATLLVCLNYAAVAAADTSSADSLKQALRNSAWSGVFQFRSYQGQIRLAFLSEPNINGDLQYFANVDPTGFPFVLRETLKLDKPCPFTPRVLTLQSPSTSDNSFAGKISVYFCASTADEEAVLAADPNRMPELQPKITSLKLSDDQRHLHISATMGLGDLIHIDYDFSRQTIDSSEQALNWVNSIP